MNFGVSVTKSNDNSGFSTEIFLHWPENIISIKTKSGNKILRSNFRFHTATTVVSTMRQVTVKSFYISSQLALSLRISNL